MQVFPGFSRAEGGATEQDPALNEMRVVISYSKNPPCEGVHRSTFEIFCANFSDDAEITPGLRKGSRTNLDYWSRERECRTEMPAKDVRRSKFESTDPLF